MSDCRIGAEERGTGTIHVHRLAQFEESSGQDQQFFALLLKCNTMDGDIERTEEDIAEITGASGKLQQLLDALPWIGRIINCQGSFR